MAIIFAGSSLAELILANGPTAYTGANKYQYVSEGIETQGPALAILDLPTAKSDFWLSFYAAHASATGTSHTGLSFFNKAYSQTSALFGLSGGSNSTTMNAYYWNGSGSVNFDNGSPSGMAGLQRYDIHVKIADSGGIFEVYRNGILDIELTGGDTKFTSATGIDRITFGTLGVGTSQYSAIIVADEDTRGYRLAQSLPSGAGATSGWSGSYTDIDETGINDSDTISTGVLNSVSTFNFAAINSAFNSSAFEVVAVVEAIRASSSPSIAVDVAAVIRSGGTDYPTPGLGTESIIGTYQVIWPTDPATSAAWTYASANSAQLGVKQVP